ncbi:MAG TPA: hypothetical protein VFN37_00775 [Candidatus Baltobacteraceae bacterium]|nr:hypothetical protein [Candidatus Baltobacteraceae bacterium]
MTTFERGGASGPSTIEADADARYVAWFQELDAWTEYWDVYHPESKGRYYFGDGISEPGLLTRLLPNQIRPAVFTAWSRMALGSGTTGAFVRELTISEVASAALEIDGFVARLFAEHFGDAGDRAVQRDYLEAIFRFATDTLPPAAERETRIDPADPRKATAGRHTLDSDIMWFAWAFELEAAHLLQRNGSQPRHALLMAGVATGCAANFAWRGHRRTRPQYNPDAATHALLQERGLQWASNFQAAADEVHCLYRIREWGHD